MTRTSTEFIRGVSAPQGGYFDTTRRRNRWTWRAQTRAFLSAHAGAFANKSAKLGYTAARVRTKDDRNYVRMQQTYAGIPVFGGSTVVQLNSDKSVSYVLAGILTDTKSLDEGSLPTTPSVSAALAARVAIDCVAGLHPALALKTSKAPLLTIYAPSVVGNKGDTILAWQVDVVNASGTQVDERVFVNAGKRRSGRSGTPCWRIFCFGRSTMRATIL